MNRQHMAIVKATYTKKAREAKDYLRYIQHRKGLDGHRATRELYGHEGVMERVQGYELIDNAEKGTVFFRIIINPDPATEDTRKDLSLPEITAQAMQTLATRIARDVPYIAATHADHTPLRHAHILALVKGRLGREDLQALRETATQEALTQRKERDLAREQQQQREGGGGRTSALSMHRLLAQLSIVCTRIIAFFTESQSLHHARFAHFHELAPLLTSTFDELGVLLGTSRFNQILSVRPTKKRRELGNTLVVAPPRSGKSVLATAQLLTWPHSVVVNDVKGELFAATAGYRRKLGKVYVIDPTGVGHRYDPTAGKHTDLELKAIAKGLLFKPDESDGEIFTQRGIRMLSSIFHAARLEQMPLLPYVAHLINEPVQAVAARLNVLDPALATRFLDGSFEDANFSDRFLLSAWGTLTARLDALLSDSVVQCVAGSDFAPKELLLSAEPITIYLRWKEQDLLVLSPLVRLLWSSLIDELITTYDRHAGRNCHPMLLLIDEAGRTAIPSLSDYATTVVGRGITLWLAIQSLAQLDVVYGKNRATVLRDTAETQLYYRPANQETAAYLEQCLGRRSEHAHSQTLREGTATSEGRTEQGIPLLTAWEIKQLRDEEIIGFHRSIPPFRAKRMDWRAFPLLVQRQLLPPPELSPLPTRDLHLPLLGQVIPAFPDGFIDPDRILL